METRESKPAVRMINATTLVAEAYCPTCERSFPEAMDRCPDDDTRLVRLAERKDSLIGTDLDGRFDLEECIGVGGMGTVYRATDLQTDQKVAVKVIRELASDLVTAKRFLREAKLAKRLNHDNVVRVLDFGQTPDGVLYLAMELVEGVTLERLVTTHGAVAPVLVCRVAEQIFEALECAHDHGIVHRDLKPSNVMILNDPSQSVKILDFGLAKSLGGDFTTTDAGSIMGTPAYLAPELILGREVTPAVDLYAVGVVLYELLSGDLPFTDDDVPAVLMAHAYRPPPPLPSSVPLSLSNLVLRLLAKKAADRFPSAKAAREAFRFAVAATGSVTRPAFIEAKTVEQTMDEIDPADVFTDDSGDEEEGTWRSTDPLFEEAPTGTLPRVAEDAPTAPMNLVDLARQPAGKATVKPARDGDAEANARVHHHYRKTKQLVAIAAEDLIFEVAAAAAAEPASAAARAPIREAVHEVTLATGHRGLRLRPLVFAALFALGFILVWLFVR